MSEAEQSQEKPMDQGPIVLDAKSLFQGRTEIFIEYEGTTYRLRITKKGRLLLQK
jgi:hemin uptake protein HemP